MSKNGFDFLFTEQTPEETHDVQNAEEEVVVNGKDNTSSPSLRPGSLTPNQLIQFDITPAYDSDSDLRHLHNGLHSENLNTKFCSIL